MSYFSIVHAITLIKISQISIGGADGYLSESRTTGYGSSSLSIASLKILLPALNSSAEIS